MEYHKSGMADGAVGAVIFLIVGVGISVLVLIFVSALSGQTYQLVEPDLDAITNTTVKNSAKNAIISGFSALEQTGKYLPIIVLGIVITIVLALVLSLGAFGGMRGGGGSAL